MSAVRAMVLDRAGEPLRARDLPDPEPGPGEIRLVVAACAVCRTDLHVVDGELDRPALPLVPGHQIVGRVDRVGTGVTRFAPGDRAGVPWLGRACGACRFCRSGRENLCDAPEFTGYTRDGGFAELAVADARFALPLPAALGGDAEVAPLLCAGLIGHRALRMAGDGRRLGLWGFGAAAHIVIQIAVHQGREVHAFTRPGDARSQAFARSLGAVWAGGSDESSPAPLDASILFAPVGSLVPAALAATDKGGRVVCAGIHMSDIPSFPYHLLWGERSLVSVANLTRQDGADLVALAERAPIATEVTRYDLADANRALADLRGGRIDGAAVLVTGRI
jgi:alcohol dehydrogenase, propanol-preferring